MDDSLVSTVTSTVASISHQPSAISHQPSATSHQPPATSHQPSAKNFQVGDLVFCNYAPTTVCRRHSVFTVVHDGLTAGDGCIAGQCIIRLVRPHATCNLDPDHLMTVIVNGDNLVHVGPLPPPGTGGMKYSIMDSIYREIGFYAPFVQEAVTRMQLDKMLMEATSKMHTRSDAMAHMQTMSMTWPKTPACQLEALLRNALSTRAAFGVAPHGRLARLRRALPMALPMGRVLRAASKGGLGPMLAALRADSRCNRATRGCAGPQAVHSHPVFRRACAADVRTRALERLQGLRPDSLSVGQHGRGTCHPLGGTQASLH